MSFPRDSPTIDDTEAIARGDPKRIERRFKDQVGAYSLVQASGVASAGNELGVRSRHDHRNENRRTRPTSGLGPHR